MKRTQKWLKLDNAAKIYPAAKTKNWTNIYRLSATLKEDIDPDILAKSLNDIKRRFPSICVKLKAGIFWYYLEEIDNAPEVCEEGGYTCMRMKFSDIKKCAFRVLYYKNRITTEFFHSLTDGNGALIFLKTLTATYLENKYGIDVPHENGVLDISRIARRDELEDSFLKYSGKVSMGRKDTDAYIYKGTHILEDFTPLITGEIAVEDIKKRAKEYNVSITTYLAAVMTDALQQMQAEEIKRVRSRKPIKILLPVNLRSFYPSNTLRNFVLYIIPGIKPNMGHYSFDEIVKSIHHQMGYELTEKQMNSRIVTNVRDELNPIVRIIPLFMKNVVMKIIYNMSGEKKSTITISNLGDVKLPEIMNDYIDRFDFILTPQLTLPGNCSVISYKGKMYISFVRNINETTLEKYFFTRLVKNGIHVKIESNRR
ncbi:MAG: alcohol acetyltransferase [Ruminococcaceae bacterium]|nr:alcohol acetyltransferase [Oscillospiraceae bacterium]